MRILRRSSLAQTINAFIGRFMCDFPLSPFRLDCLIIFAPKSLFCDVIVTTSFGPVVVVAVDSLPAPNPLLRACEWSELVAFLPLARRLSRADSEDFEEDLFDAPEVRLVAAELLVDERQLSAAGLPFAAVDELNCCVGGGGEDGPNRAVGLLCNCALDCCCCCCWASLCCMAAATAAAAAAAAAFDVEFRPAWGDCCGACEWIWAAACIWLVAPEVART